MLAPLVLVFRPSGALGDEAQLTEWSSAEQAAKAAALHQVNELSNRRRLTTFFINEQTPFYGVQINYVNVGRGNLTFLNRDLARLGPIPIVIGRVYDSRLGARSDFGTGWKLSVSEVIRIDERRLRYIDASGSEHLLDLDGLGIRSPYPHLTGIERGRRVGPFIELDVGELVKRFRWIGDALYLDEVRNREGDQLKLEYQGTQIVRVVSSHGRFVALRRDSAGRITEIEDDAGRTVSYEYDAAGRLALVTDVGGKLWQIAYDARGLLTSVVDPRDSDALIASHGDDGRVQSVRVLFDSMSFEYQGASTTVRNALQQAATFWQSASGLTTAARDFAGSLTELNLSEQLRPLTLTFDGRLIAKFEHDANGRLDEATSLLGGEPSTTRIQYDRGGRIFALSTDEDVAAEYRYDARGRVISAWDESGARSYEYAGRSVRRFTVGHSALELQTDDLGLLTGFRNDHQTVRLGYDALDQLDRLSYTAYGQVSETEYQYGPGGLRTEGAYTLGEAADFVYAFAYDEVGNLSELHGEGTNGERGEQTYVLGDNNQLMAVRNSARPDLVFEYDFAGRPTAVVFDRQRTSYQYDELGRLSSAYRDDAKVAEWTYGPMDVDAATEADGQTSYVTVQAPIASAIFGSLESIAYARTRGSPYGPIRFNATMARFVLATTPVAPPDQIVLASFKRRALPVFAAAHGYDGHLTEVASPGPMGFDKPSNGLFLPAEFSSLNCFYCLAWHSGANPANTYMKINGTSSGTATAVVGQNALIEVAYTGPPPLCFADTPPLVPVWHHGTYISNGVYGEGYTPGSNIAMTTYYAFPAPGTYTVYDYISCGCGYPQVFFGQVQRNVQANPSSTPGVVTILYTMYIPLDHVRLPLAWRLFSDTFYGADSQVTYPVGTTKYRVQQEVRIDTTNKTVQNISRPGTTTAYDDGVNLTSSGTCFRKDCSNCASYPDFSSMVFQGQCKTGSPFNSGPASNMNTVTASKVSETSTSMTVRFTGAPVNALQAAAAAIDWTHQITINWAASTPTWSLSLSHDGFPTHEVRINGNIVYQFHPVCDSQTPTGTTVECHSQTPASLGPFEEWQFTRSGNL